MRVKATEYKSYNWLPLREKLPETRKTMLQTKRGMSPVTAWWEKGGIECGCFEGCGGEDVSELMNNNERCVRGCQESWRQVKKCLAFEKSEVFSAKGD
ncbi:hypothetical protein CEXT_763731 [Caerostris extrusa]|uniref:Uncharacterized protein n=1 Tax=Caerostris extrusa TaxID=172846 RepID=A0AAV4WBA1_CAEEX|nr:hypothetical protein CEXT_763731 [Caerostris extrusa]